MLTIVVFYHKYSKTVILINIHIVLLVTLVFYCCDGKSEFSAAITPVSRDNLEINVMILCSRNISYYY